MERPTRTREHQIADLSVNHVERFILQQGHSAERVYSDYGYDVMMKTFDYGASPARARGAFESGLIYLQFKATDTLNVLDDGSAVTMPITRRHINLWRLEPMPVILVVYDAISEQAWWTYVQRQLQASGTALRPNQQGFTFRLSTQNIVNDAAVEDWRRIKADVSRRVEERGTLHE